MISTAPECSHVAIVQVGELLVDTPATEKLMQGRHVDGWRRGKFVTFRVILVVKLNEICHAQRQVSFVREIEIVEILGTNEIVACRLIQWGKESFDWPGGLTVITVVACWRDQTGQHKVRCPG